MKSFIYTGSTTECDHRVIFRRLVAYTGQYIPKPSFHLSGEEIAETGKNKRNVLPFSGESV